MAAGRLRPRGSCRASPPSLPGLEPVPHHCATLCGRLVGASLHTEAAEVPGSRRPLLGCHRAVAAAAGAREKRCRARMRGRERGRNGGPPRRPPGAVGSRRGEAGEWLGWQLWAWSPVAKLASMGGLSSPDRVEGKRRPQGAARSLAASAPCAAVTVSGEKNAKSTCVVLECHASYGQKHACPSIPHSFGVVSRPICWDSKRY